MPQDSRIALFLLAELVAALQANDPDTFKRWLYGCIQDLSHIHSSCWNTSETLIRRQHLVAQGLLPVEKSSVVLRWQWS